ncbi:MAG: efflux RND transporter periplasmic adaptor subunit, partial [Planctomycetota bacterium]
TETKLFSLQDLSRVWVQASVYEKDIAQVSRGQKAILHVDAFPQVAFEGEVTYLSYQVDPATRAVALRIEIENTRVPSWEEDYPLRPGMFGTVELAIARRDAPLVVPERAIVHEGEDHFVFIREGERRFERRQVQIREGGMGLVEVVSGLEPGQEVVTEGSFVLKSMARSSEMGEGHEH